MNLCQVTGLTPEQLHRMITKSPVGFSAEDGSIQYLGRHIQLHDGVTALSGQTFVTVASKQLYERLVSIQTNFATQITRTKAEAIKMAASKLWDEFHFDAIERSPTKEVQCAVFLESMRLGPLSSMDMVLKLAETDSLTWADKLQIMLAADAKHARPLSAKCWFRVGIPLSIRLEKTKNLFQGLPDTPVLAEQVNEINEHMAVLNPDKLVKDRLLEIRQFIELENNQLSRQLLGEVDNIEKKFIPRVEESGNLPKRDNRYFLFHTTRLLYLYAACSGFSQEADIAELASYIRTVLYSANSENIWHIAQELAYLSKQSGSIGYYRYIDAVANILKAPVNAPVKAPVNVALQFENIKQLSDINGFSLLENKKTLAPYLTALKTNIENITPEYSTALLHVVKDLESKFSGMSLPESKPAIKAKVHRLLLVIAACKSPGHTMDNSVLVYFVMAIMEHKYTNNIPYLISGLSRLVQSTPKIQQILGKPVIRGGELLRLAPLQLLAFVPEIISEDDLEKLNESLQATVSRRRRMKDRKVFHQWLATLEQILVSQVMNKAMVIPLLSKLTQNLTYEKLVLLYITFKVGNDFNEFLDSMGFSCQKEGLPLVIAEKGVNALEGVNKKFPNGWCNNDIAIFCLITWHP